MPTTLDLTPDQIERYRESAKKRLQAESKEIESRREQAWQAAKRASRVLKNQFGATRVVVFGSLVQKAGFTRWSDVDVAAWGIAPEDTFQAIGIISELDTSVPVNLVDVNTARTSLIEVIERDGIEL
jgi:predicted nucleotidyltransferase